MKETKQKRKLNYSTLKETMVPEKQAVLDAVNHYEAERGNSELEERNRRSLEYQLSKFETMLPADFPEREWHILTMQGMVASTLGDFESAIELDLSSLNFAKTNEQEAISNSNLSEDFRYVGRHEDALKAALKAYRLNPHHKGYVWNYAVSLSKLGRTDEAKRIIDLFMSSRDEENPADLFNALLKHDDEMKELIG